jgi:hypothetical protein
LKIFQFLGNENLSLDFDQEPRAMLRKW